MTGWEGFRFEPLGEKHLPLRPGFSCGVEALDQYLRQRARKEMEQGLAAVQVLYDVAENRIAGYYTLSAMSVEPGNPPLDVARKLPRYPALPAFLIGRLATDLGYRGRGFGKLLLMDALSRAYELRDQVAALAVIVDAKDDAAATFYERYGFIRFVDQEGHLFIPMKTIGMALEERTQAPDW